MKLSKSEQIREIFRKSPNMHPVLVRKTLASKGIKVTLTLVYVVRKRIAGAQPKLRPDITIVLEHLMAVRNLVKQVGGMEKMKCLIRVVEMLAAA